MAALKYAGLHAVALLTALGFLLGGPWMWTGIVIIFALAAVADEVLGEDHGPARDQKSWLYEVLLWVTPFVQSIVVVCLALQVGSQPWYYIAGGVLGAGFIFGGLGLVVGHELIHRLHSKWERFAGTLLYAATFDSYFAWSHPFGHHRHVGTDKDTSTARRGETLYAFIWRSATTSWMNGYEIGVRKTRNQLKDNFAWYKNPVVWQHSYSLFWLALWGLFGGWVGLGVGVLVGLLGKCLLEAVNYIEHYGLTREAKTTVQPHHSWNSASIASQYLLFNLSRHSDHHANGLKPYQTLDSSKALPTLPHGYLTMILFAMLPPLYFKKMRTPLARWDMAYG